MAIITNLMFVHLDWSGGQRSSKQGWMEGLIELVEGSNIYDFVKDTSISLIISSILSLSSSFQANSWIWHLSGFIAGTGAAGCKIKIYKLNIYVPSLR